MMCIIVCVYFVMCRLRDFRLDLKYMNIYGFYDELAVNYMLFSCFATHVQAEVNVSLTHFT